MIFTKKAALKQLLFVLFLFALLIPVAVWDSNSQVRVHFDDTSVQVKSDKYTMDIPYSEIASAELTGLAAPGEKVRDSFDDDILRTGIWRNDAWGEYCINADLDATNCVLLRLTDGRVFVISRKDNDTTREICETLLSHISAP